MSVLITLSVTDRLTVSYLRSLLAEFSRTFSLATARTVVGTMNVSSHIVSFLSDTEYDVSEHCVSLVWEVDAAAQRGSVYACNP